MKPICRIRAFTLVELLVVVAIISLLSAIAVPNFLNAQTRAKVARVKADMRTIAGALELYQSDNNCYPPVPILLPPRFRFFIPLTSPISYMTDIPRDPFQSVDQRGFGRWRRGMYFYGGTPIDNPFVWALGSDGPDRNHDAFGIMMYPGYSPHLFNGNDPDIHLVLYDPTNGVISRGDIMRVSDHNLE